MNTKPMIRALMLSVFLVSACATGPTVIADKVPEADVHAYRTLAFFDRVTTDDAAYSTILTSRSKQTTRTELERERYQ